MQVRESDASRVVLELDHNELILVNNALNEVCHGIDLPDFTTLLGARWEELEALRLQVSKALATLPPRPDDG